MNLLRNLIIFHGILRRIVLFLFSHHVCVCLYLFTDIHAKHIGFVKLNKKKFTEKNYFLNNSTKF